MFFLEYHIYFTITTEYLIILRSALYLSILPYKTQLY